MTSIPKGAKVPDDHKKSAAQIEAEGVTMMEVPWNGMTLLFPADVDDWPMEAVLAFEEGKVTVALRAGMGAEQWLKVTKTKPLKRDITAMYEALGETLGFEASGN